MPEDRKKRTGESQTGKKFFRLMKASEDLEEALQMAAQGLKMQLAQDQDGRRIADGEFRAENLNSVACAIERQTQTRIMLSGTRGKSVNKGSAVTVQMSPETEAMAE